MESCTPWRARAERVRHVQLRIGGQRRGFRVGVDAEHAEIARDLMHGEGAGRGLRIDQNFAAVGVDQFARHAGRFLRLALGVADHHLDLPAGKAAGGVDLLDFDHHAHCARRCRAARRGPKESSACRS